MELNTPILFIAFNRPDTTKIVFDRIRQAKPKKLYVVIDGPRENRNGEKHRCKEVTEITNNIDWNCDAKYRIREKNIGCRASVVDAISWVFEIEDRVIIIEDDVVPELNFFSFAEDLLEKYLLDERIGMISGTNYTPILNQNGDYLFSRYAHIWGWATWKRVWSKFDVECPDLEISLRRNNLRKMIPNKVERLYFKNFFSIWLEKQKNGTANAWGPFYFFYIFKNNYLSIVPNSNLVSNIGVEGEHTNSTLYQHFWETDTNYKLNKHPNMVEHSIEYDKIHFDKHINRIKTPTLFQRIVIKFKSILPK